MKTIKSICNHSNFTSLVTMLIILNLSNLVNAQWVQQTSGTSNFLWSVNYPITNIPTIAYAVGENGVILKTENSSTWSIQSSGTTQTLTSVNFGNLTTGCAVGVNGTIVSTNNGGNNWSIRSSGTTWTLYSVHFVPGYTTVFAVGMNGTILKSTNSGINWTSQNSGTTQVLRSVYFTSLLTGYVVGANGTILKTSNGGNNWTIQTSGTSYDINSVCFLGTISTTGYAVGNFGTILKTINGGASWTPQTSGTNATLASVFCIDANTVYVVGLAGTLLKTTSGGVSWSSQVSGTSNYLYSVYFADDVTGYIVGTGGTILHTTNGGEYCTSPYATVDDVSGPSPLTITCDVSGGSVGNIFYKWYSGTSCSGTVLGTNSTLQVTASGNYACKAYISGFESTCYDCDYGYAQIIQPPVLTLSPATHDFGNVTVNQYSPNYTFTIENTGGGTATGSVTLTGTNANQFEITSGGGSFSLTAGQTKSIIVRFHPTSTGLKSATLFADGNSPCNDANSSLTGTGGDGQPPVVTTSAVSNITTTSATSGGNVTNQGTTPVTARGVCWSTSQNPTIADNHTSDGAGTGEFVSNLTGLAPNTTYFVRAYATNNAGTSYGNEVNFTTILSTGFACGDVVVYEQQNYNTIQIGTQCWFKENLNAGTMIAGTNNQTNNGTIEKYCYDDIAANCNTLGGLYQWDEMMQFVNSPSVKGICPSGWYIPSYEELITLTNFLNNSAGGKMKSTGTIEAGTGLWYYPNTDATNESGFTALSGGYRWEGLMGSFDTYGYRANFWSSSETSSTNSSMIVLTNESGGVYSFIDTPKSSGFSLRCLRDETTPPLQLNITPINQQVTSESGSTTFDITSNTNWTVQESVSWFSVTPINGSNNETLTVSYDANDYGSQRVGIITAFGNGVTEPVTFTVTQEAQLFTPTLELGPDVTVCENTSGFSSGALMNFEQVCDWNGWDQMWSGDGIIDPIFPICCPWEATYHPGPWDLANGFVSCNLEILCCENGVYQWVSDWKTFYFQEAPLTDAGSDKIISRCEQIMIDASASGSGNLSYSWQPSTFLDNPTLLNPTFGNAPTGTYILTLLVTDNLGCTSSDQLEINVIPDQLLSLNIGWSGVSSYFIPQDPNIVNLYNTGSQNLTILYNLSGTLYYPQFGIYPAQPWSVYSGYIVKMSSENQIEICGSIPEDCTLNLNSGWNLMPMLNNESLSTNDVFESISQVQIVKEVAGSRLYWKQYNINTLESIEPGKAYFVRMSSAGSISFPPFNFNGIKNMTVENSNTEESSPWGLVHKTPSSHIIAIPAGITNQISDQSFVGAFTSEGSCAGSCSIRKDQSQVLIVNMDDPLTSEKDGFIDGERLSFMIWDASADKVLSLQIEFDKEQPDYSGTFMANGISAISKMQIINNIQENSIGNIQIFPNPSHDYLNISGIVDGTNVRLTLLTLSGQEILSKTLNSNGQIDMSIIPNAMYLVKLEDGLSVRYEKVVLE